MELTILILTYNEENNIERCLESISKQKVNPYIVLSDDGSTDNTIEVAEKCLAGLKFRHLIIKNRINSGINSNAIRAFEKIKNRNHLLMRVDGDDTLPENTLHLMIEQYRPGSFIIGSYNEISEDKQEVVHPKSVWDSIACNTMIHTQDIVKVGGLARSNTGIFIEYDLYARLLLKGFKPQFCNQVMYNYHRNNNSITSNISRVAAGFSELEKIWGFDLIQNIRDY